ncbi:MAG: DNA-3-methyladenine glycosylase 2 family protein [Alphaproteobacteria bacterium]|nr:DNA-3-methyladenine glycosylase 2 family protein [Alphaproteobacteria bacterium]MCW5738590.1 DNA-3-methyladenine glycosylase 2 family protein [Alphaproteobacteria bacterium]
MSIPFRLTEEHVLEGMTALGAIDPRFAAGLATYGQPPLRSAEEGYAALLRAIVGQQVSVYAARSIWDRVAALVVPMTPQRLLEFSDAELRACGLSNNKVKFARSLALDTAEKRIVFEHLPELDDDAVIAMLTQAKGIGRWTAEIYMMFALGRPDVMPANDLGIIVAAQHFFGLRRRPDPKRLLTMAEAWRPWRTVASLFLWHYRHNMPDFSDSPAAIARRAAERLAKEERKAKRAAAPKKPAAKKKTKKPAAKKKAAAKKKPAPRRRS